MRCYALFFALFKKEAAGENPLWRRASEASGGGREEMGQTL